jgi:hypothetical protein
MRVSGLTTTSVFRQSTSRLTTAIKPPGSVVGPARLDLPLLSAMVPRTAGWSFFAPRGITVRRWQSFDGYLLGLAAQQGARILRQRVDDVDSSGPACVR